MSATQLKDRIHVHTLHLILTGITVRNRGFQFTVFDQVRSYVKHNKFMAEAELYSGEIFFLLHQTCKNELTELQRKRVLEIEEHIKDFIFCAEHQHQDDFNDLAPNPLVDVTDFELLDFQSFARNHLQVLDIMKPNNKTKLLPHPELSVENSNTRQRLVFE